MNKKRLAIILILTTVVLSLFALTGAYIVSAKDTGNYPPIVQKIAEKFNLNPKKVSAVLEECHKEKAQKHKAKLNEKLSKAVKVGKITEKQKAEILKIMGETHKKMKDIKGLSPEDRHIAMKESKQEIKKWAEDNNVDLMSILGHGPRMLGKRGNKRGKGSSASSGGHRLKMHEGHDPGFDGQMH